MKLSRALILLLASILLAGCDLLSGLLGLSSGVKIDGTVVLAAGLPAGHQTVVLLATVESPLSADFPKTSFYKSTSLSVAPGGVGSFAFPELPEGSYSLAGFYDLDDDGDFDLGEPCLQVSYHGTSSTLGYFSIHDTLTAEISISVATFRLTYNANGADSGTPPQDPQGYLAGAVATVRGPNDLALFGYAFDGWSAMSDGSGTVYAQNDPFTLPAWNVTLYARWRETSPLVTATSSAPDLLITGTAASFRINGYGDGYVAVPTFAGKGYGLYLTPQAGANLSVSAGSFTSGYASFGLPSTTSATGVVMAGFKTALNSSAGAKITNTSSSPALFDVVVREGILGDSSLAAISTAPILALDSPTWVAATAATGYGTDFSFTTGATGSAFFTFSELTAAVTVEVLSADKLTSLFGPATIDATTISQGTSGGLTAGTTYVLRITSAQAGGLSVGSLLVQ